MGQGKYEEAEPHLQRALAINEKVLGPDHPSTATALNNLAGLYKPWGQYIRTVTDGKIPGGVVAERKSKESQCAKRRDTIKSSSASCVQKSAIVWNARRNYSGVLRFQTDISLPSSR
ncbi:MAG TPA: tetratricopeptide repeat protein, partial [Ktedonosporobacter sp.]|nr:tetratricopeptide repeat protein [Ktedonosporobacter sp.]